MTVLGLRCCAGFSLVAVRGATLPLQSTVSRALQFQQSWLRTLELRVNSCGPRGLHWSEACGTLSDQGSNSCLLYWQAGSLPLSHQESPCIGCISTNGHYSRTVIRKQHRISIFPITCMQSFSPRLALSGGPTGNSAQCYVAA